MTNAGRKSGCCVPAAHETSSPAHAGRPAPDWAGTGTHGVEQAWIARGRFMMGDLHRDGYHSDGESPIHVVELAPYSIDATAVTVADFASFIAATGYVTDAERCGNSAVFHTAIRAEPEDILGIPQAVPWWRFVSGADWRHPGGRHSDAFEHPDHPVTHVSWGDAAAYCLWVGRRLPTEAEWEYASRGGLAHARFPWGDALPDDGKGLCNVWQGDFPDRSSRTDGSVTTVPARSYEPNGYGLWQTIGNVWEWCADWFSRTYYDTSPQLDPSGPASGCTKVMRGGSYLCHRSYCYRYRNSARSSNTVDASTAHIGFRTAGAGR